MKYVEIYLDSMPISTKSDFFTMFTYFYEEVHFVTCDFFLHYFSRKSLVVLGIETSCDDTACGIVTDNGTILADKKHSQLQFHLKLI